MLVLTTLIREKQSLIVLLLQRLSGINRHWKSRVLTLFLILCNTLSTFTKNIAPYVIEELLKAKQARASGDYSLEFRHLENAHILGQESTLLHAKVHYLMMLWGVRQNSIREVFGQIIRLTGAVFLTQVKGVPIGNTGGSNVSPVKVMPIKAELAEIIARAKNEAN